LDSYYNPIKVYNFRSEDKEKWISPSNFVIWNKIKPNHR
jgi:hypothetical protein